MTDALFNSAEKDVVTTLFLYEAVAAHAYTFYFVTYRKVSVARRIKKSVNPT